MNSALRALVVLTMAACVTFLSPVTHAGLPCFEVTMSAGAGNPSDTTYALNETTWYPILQIDFAGTGDDAYDMLDIATSGTGDESTDVTGVRLYASDDDTFDAATDTHVGSGSFTVDNETVSIGFSVALDVTPRKLFLAYQFAPTTAKGATFNAEVSDNAALIPMFCAPTTTTGAPVTSGTVTMTYGSASVAAGTSNPTSGIAFTGETNVPILQIAVTADAVEGLDLDQLTITDSEAAANPELISAVNVWHDVDGDGIVSEGDVQLGAEAQFTEGVDTLTITSLGHQVPAGATDMILITYDFASATTAALIDTADIISAAKRWARLMIQAPFALAGCGGSSAATATDETTLGDAPDGFVFTDTEGNTIVTANAGDTVQLRTTDGAKALQFTMGSVDVSFDGATIVRDANGLYLALPTAGADTTAAVSGLSGEITAFIPCDADDDLLHVCPEENSAPEGNPVCASGNLLSASQPTAGTYVWDNAVDRTGDDDCMITGTLDDFASFYGSGKTQTSYAFQASLADAADVTIAGSESARDFTATGSAIQGGTITLIGN